LFRPAIDAWENAVRFSNHAKPSADTPIQIQPRNRDEGLQVRQSGQSLTLAGEAKGSDRPAQDIYDAFERGGREAPKTRGVGLSLDADRAPTRNVWGETDYTEKNERSFYVGTQPGESARAVAERLAAEVNRGDDFRATVSGSKGQARIDFVRA
jgi:hypothetical protein